MKKPEKTTGKKLTGIQTENTSQGRDRVGIIMMLIHGVFFIGAIILIIQLFGIWLVYKPNPEYVKAFTPQARKSVTIPERGSILAMDGRLLAVSVPVYQVYMDCAVRKREFQEKEDGKALEQKWMEKARELSKGLARIYGDKTADQYYDLIARSRAAGYQYVKIGTTVNYDTLVKLKQLPLFNEPSYQGGMIVERRDSRDYPYGNLARRTIGSVRNNNQTNDLIGIEGKYNYILHGAEGIEWQRKTDLQGWIRDYDSTLVKVRNGEDVRTTIDIDIQDIVDRALREKILENDIIEGGCAIVMDVHTGAIRAMANLMRDKNGVPSEIYNYAVGRSGDPGSVFKLATLMTLLEDEKIQSLEEEVPTYRGTWVYRHGNSSTTFTDEYLQRRGADKITIRDGFKISSNNVFRQLVCQYYGDNPSRFTDKLYEYKLTDAFDFDLIGLAKPTVVTPDQPNWSGTALPSIAIGYTVNETPLHIITFYNAVANKGKMMKPYLVEDFEVNGHVTKKLGPSILNGAICTKATADTLLRALLAVTEEGTGRAVKNARCKVAGKTGTAQIPFETKVNGKSRVVYKDTDGNRKHQATFVGFFPAEDPKYTAIVVLYSKLGKSNLYGAAAIPAFKTIVDEVYAITDDWGEEIK